MNIRYYHFSLVDSTNAFAKQQIKECSPDDILIITADEQSKGYGRQSRPWKSPKGKNILLTIAFYNPTIPPFFFSQIASLTLYELLQDISPKIKWPNDLLIGDKKISGCLVEVADGFTIVGIGLNVNMSHNELAAIPQLATSVFAKTGKEQDLQALQKALIDSFIEKYKKATIDGIATFQEEWLQKVSWMLFKERSISDAGKILSGTITSIHTDGTLELTLKDGTKQLIYSGDLFP